MGPRSVVALAIDVVLHTGIALAAALYVEIATTGSSAIAFLLTYVVTSLLHRIVVQRVTATTIGKALTGLQYIRTDTGGPPKVGSLILAWFAIAYGSLGTIPS
ncbi:RDD family protein [Pseudonocardia sp. GCM10023141]|uniref:RDD family protein n=1 Tax=Pseudonocardia sp. GCM10023141 TaxID=3252653 RepID=UPI00360C0331